MFEHPKFCVWSGHRVLIRTVCLVLQDRFRKQSGFPSSVAFCYSAQVAVSSCYSIKMLPSCKPMKSQAVNYKVAAKCKVGGVA